MACPTGQIEKFFPPLTKPICVPIGSAGTYTTADAAKAATTSSSKPKNQGLPKWLSDALGIIVPAVPGVILATKGKDVGVQQFDTGGGSGGNDKDPAKPATGGLPTWAYVVIGIMGFALIFLILNALKNRSVPVA